jgi:hypothetical protein
MAPTRRSAQVVQGPGLDSTVLADLTALNISLSLF